MKYLAVLFLLYTNAFAGTPDQDLIVDLMRERFISSSPIVDKNDIQPGKNWTCVYYNARKGIMPNYTNYRELFNFEEVGVNQFHNTKDYLFKDFHFTSEGHFIGSSEVSFLYARKVKDGTLIFEYAGDQYRLHRSYVSVSNPRLSGHGYIYCK